jgi:hypothetical protein
VQWDGLTYHITLKQGSFRTSTATEVKTDDIGQDPRLHSVSFVTDSVPTPSRLVHRKHIQLSLSKREQAGTPHGSTNNGRPSGKSSPSNYQGHQIPSRTVP